MGYRRVAIVVVRNQIGWFNSRIAQKRKMIHPIYEPFEAQIEDMMAQEDGNWEFLFQNELACGFELHVLAHNDAFKSRGVVESPMVISDLPTPGQKAVRGVVSRTIAQAENLGMFDQQ